jgi:RNA polymerase sigma factor (sigma-70 family)
MDVEDLYRRYGHVLLRRCWALLGRREDALDALQETFARTLRYRWSFRDDRRPLPWLYQIATRVCFDLRRQRARGAPEGAALSAPAGIDPERAATLAELLARCDALTREIVLAYHMERMSMDEIAALVGRSRKTVGKKLARFQAETGTRPRDAPVEENAP